MRASATLPRCAQHRALRAALRAPRFLHACSCGPAKSRAALWLLQTFFGGQDPFDVLLKGGGMPGGFGMHFASMNGGGMGGGRGGCGPNGGPRMMFSSMGGMPGGMGGMGGMGFGPEMMFGGMPGGMGGGGGCGGMGGRGMGGRSVRPKRSVGFNELAPNTLVSISGLRSAAHQNGKHARVLSYDPEKQRYTVRLLEGDDDSGGASGEQLAVRVDNLHAVVDVELTDVSSSPALNGTTGRLLSYDSDSGRYHVRLHDGRIAALAPTSVIVPSGTCCTVTGLASASAQQHNGARAKVVGYDRASGRYEVAVSPSSHLKLKRENVRV